MHKLISSAEKFSINDVRNLIVGLDKKVKLLDGSEKQYIFFDNAASTPAFKNVRDTVNELLEWYSGVHRGAGIKSLVSTQAYDDAHDIVADFFGADKNLNTVIFGKNTTEGINKLAYRLNLTRNDIVLVSSMEHHSNDLPWRKFANVVFIDINKDGTLNLTDLKNKVEKYSGKLRVIAVTGAANVTGLVNPIYEIAELAHSHNAMIAVDAAQLAPHRAIDVKPNDHPQHIDFLIISAHKLYAPYGTGALIGPKKIFESGEPEYVGGGTISIVTHEQVNWAELPDKEEAGTPNLLGAVALAKSLQILNSIGMENVAEHEIELTDYILKKVKHIDEFKLLGPKEFNDLRNKLGVITFNLEGFHNSLVSSILCYEFGIGVRSGCFCAHPYIKELLGVTKEESDLMIKNILSGDRSDLPGAVRASFGLYNTTEEIDEFLEAIQKIIRKEYKGNYILNRRKGYYAPENFSPNIESYFKL